MRVLEPILSTPVQGLRIVIHSLSKGSHSGQKLPRNLTPHLPWRGSLLSDESLGSHPPPKPQAPPTWPTKILSITFAAAKPELVGNPKSSPWLPLLAKERPLHPPLPQLGGG